MSKKIAVVTDSNSGITQKEAKELGVLNKNVFIFDPVKKNDLPYLYRNCTVGSSYVIDLCALWDNSANKFFDTLAASLRKRSNSSWLEQTFIAAPLNT